MGLTYQSTHEPEFQAYKKLIFKVSKKIKINHAIAYCINDTHQSKILRENGTFIFCAVQITLPFGTNYILLLFYFNFELGIYIYSLACMIYVIFFVICCILVIRLISMFNKVEKTLSSTMHPQNFSQHNNDKYMITLTCLALLELA
jgi:hypothetical protein